MKYVIEAGAHDGLYQSNTRWCDYYDDITSILIEPHSYLYSRLKQNRQEKNIFVHACLVSFDYDSDEIDLLQKRDLAQSSILDIPEIGIRDRIHPKIIPSKAYTLQKILDDLNIYEIEKLYLDVEGYELEALKGIDFNKTNIKEIEVEAHFERKNTNKEKELKDFNSVLKEYYNFTKEMNPNDQIKYLFERK